MHLVTTTSVDVYSDDAATAALDFVFVTSTTTTPSIQNVGRYRDEFRRTRTAGSSPGGDPLRLRSTSLDQGTNCAVSATRSSASVMNVACGTRRHVLRRDVHHHDDVADSTRLPSVYVRKLEVESALTDHEPVGLVVGQVLKILVEVRVEPQPRVISHAPTFARLVGRH